MNVIFEKSFRELIILKEKSFRFKLTYMCPLAAKKEIDFYEINHIFIDYYS